MKNKALAGLLCYARKEVNVEDFIDYRELEIDIVDYERKKLLRQIRDQLASQFNSYEEYFKFMAALDKEVTQTLGKSADSRPRLDSAMYFDTVCYLLENKPTPQEAFAYTAELYNKDADWMKLAKNTQLRPYIHKEVISEILDTDAETVRHTVQHIIGNELDLKGAVVSSKTPNQSVRRIHKLITVSDRIDSLEKRVGDIEKRQDVAEQLIKTMVDISCRDALRIEAEKLILEGKLTRKEISKLLGISTRTLTTYAKNLKSASKN